MWLPGTQALSTLPHLRLISNHLPSSLKAPASLFISARLFPTSPVVDRPSLTRNFTRASCNFFCGLATHPTLNFFYVWVLSCMFFNEAIGEDIRFQYFIKQWRNKITELWVNSSFPWPATKACQFTKSDYLSLPDPVLLSVTWVIVHAGRCPSSLFVSLLHLPRAHLALHRIPDKTAKHFTLQLCTTCPLLFTT